MADGADDRRVVSMYDRATELAPGGPRAKAQGCVCSVLANAAYRAGQAGEPSVDPRCRLHAAD